MGGTKITQVAASALFDYSKLWRAVRDTDENYVYSIALL